MTESWRRTGNRAEAKPTPEKEGLGLPLPPLMYGKPESFDFIFVKVKQGASPKLIIIR